jgi:hypothetical protein
LAEILQSQGYKTAAVVSNFALRKKQGFEQGILVSCPSNSFTKSLELLEDGVGRRGPHEGMATAVVALNEALDLGDEVSDAPERAPTDGALGDDVEPDLDLIEPGGIGRGVVDVEGGSSREPAPDLEVLVRCVVVDDEMEVERLRYRRLNVAQELQELLVTMPTPALGEHATRGDVERGEQCRGPVADVVVRDSFDVAESQRQQGLRAVEGLDLALLVDAQNNGMVGRVEIEPDCEPSAEFGQIGLQLNRSMQQFHRIRLLDIESQVSCADAGLVEERPVRHRIVDRIQIDPAD